MPLSLLANVLQVPLSTIKGMAYKKKGIVGMTPDELSDRIKTIARVVEVGVLLCVKPLQKESDAEQGGSLPALRAPSLHIL